MVEYPLEPDGSLAVLRERRDRVALTFELEAPSLRDYIHRNPDGRVVVARAPREEDHESLLQPVDPTDQSTCSSFAAAHFADPFSPEDGLGPAFNVVRLPQHLRAVEVEPVLRTIFSDFTLQYRGLAENSSTPHSEATEHKDVAQLPNAYNTPIHLSGFVAAVHQLQMELDARTLDIASAVADNLAGWLRNGYGLISEVTPAPQQHPYPRSPNPYLTYWCVRGLADWRELTLTDEFPSDLLAEDDRKAIDQALFMALEASKNSLGRIIAVSNLYDAVGLASAVATLGLLARRLKRQDQESSSLIEQGAALLLSRYVLEDGTFAPKAAALTSRSGLSLNLSSAELAAMLIHGLAEHVPDEALKQLGPVVDGIMRQKDSVRGWGSAARGSTERRPAFVASTALSVLRMYRNILNRKIAALCARELGVMPVPQDAEIDNFALPASIRDEVQDRIIRPLTSPEHRRLATTSIILSGPPGNAKYEIVRKMAKELNWPFLVLDDGDFLRRGLSAVPAEANRVFGMLAELRDIVVLIDEHAVERSDLTKEVERSVISSAAPGLHRARGLERILLVMAVNGTPRPQLLKSRFGRQCDVLEIKAPSREERAAVLGQTLTSLGASDGLREVFVDLGVPSLTEGLTFEFLQNLVKSCVALDRSSGNVTAELVEQKIEALKSRSTGPRADEEVE